MTHIDEGTLVALRDGESVDESVLEHMSECEACRGALGDAERRLNRISGSLAGWGSPADLVGAKARVRSRLDADRARSHGSPRGLRDLRRAAAILALTAGAAYAFPGSPLPIWLGQNVPDTPSHDVSAEPGVGAGSSQEAILVPAGDGIEIVLNDVADGAEVELSWVAGATARVATGPGVKYSVAEGRVSATAPGGPIRLGIPRTAPTVSIVINGRTVFRIPSPEGETSDLAARSTERIFFRAINP